MSALDVDRDVKPHLNLTDAAYDDELQRMLDRAEAAVGTRVGSLELAQVTERVWATPNGSLILSYWPFVSLSSVTPYGGTALSLTDIDASNGVLSYVSGASFATSAAAYAVAYVHGWAEIPDDIQLGVLELVRHFWETQRGGASADKPGSFPSSPAPTGMGYAFPNRVEELLAPYCPPRAG